MAFQIHCKNKKCFKFTEAVLDPSTNEVHCSDCDEVIPDVTVFVKNQLKGAKILRAPKKETQAYSIRCNNCQKQLVPVVKKVKKKMELFCAGCDEVLLVSEPFKKLIIGAQNDK